MRLYKSDCSLKKNEKRAFWVDARLRSCGRWLESVHLHTGEQALWVLMIRSRSASQVSMVSRSFGSQSNEAAA